MPPLSESPLKKAPFSTTAPPSSHEQAKAPRQQGPESRWQNLLQETAQCATKARRSRVLFLSVLLLLLIGWLDYFTPNEFSLQDFYWLPVALATWCLGARTGYGLALASVVVATGTDYAEGIIRTKFLYLLWDILSHLISFCIFVWLLARVKQLYVKAARTSRLEIELRASQRAFEELRDFGYVIGHNWHAPLRSIDGYAQALLERYGGQLPPTGKEYLQRLRQSSHDMGELTNALLDLINYSGGKLQREPVDLSALVESIGRQLNADTEHPVALVCEPGLRTEGDGLLLRVALERLMDNAWKFTRQQAEPRVVFGARQQSDGPVYFLRDNGVGFSTAQASKLFVPYQRAHGAGAFPGVGIGLAIADRIIRRHGGRIWAEGAEGQGATFYFTLKTEATVRESHNLGEAPKGGAGSR